MSPTEVEWAYIAGLYDGEGHCQLILKNRQYALVITNSNYAVIEWCRLAVGIGWLYKSRYRERVSRNWSSVWQWKITRLSEIVTLTKGILPYLKIKYSEVKLIGDFAQRKVDRWVREPNPKLRGADSIDREFEEMVCLVKAGRKQQNACTRNTEII